MDIFTLHQGSAPLLVSLPHDGTHIPHDIAARMCAAARRSPDTDWHVGKLYDFARKLGASILKPNHSRYVVDLNRPANGHAMYPGQAETRLVPSVMFSGQAIYQDGQAVDDAEVAGRMQLYWRPYHDALQEELARLEALRGHVVLLDGHSIAGRVPMLFDGRLPDLSLGTADGKSCRAGLADRLLGILDAQQDFSHVRDARFKGGFITRHYGRPEQGIDAVQLEMVQANYMDEDSFEYLPERAANVQPVLRRLLQACLP